MIGKGGQGHIYRYGKNQVVKVLKKSAVAYRELDMTQRVQCIPGVVKLHAYEEVGDEIRMVFDKYEEVGEIGDLKKCVRDIVKTLHELHQFGIIHNDIKFENIMKNEKGEHIIIDFGCASDKYTKSTRIHGTPFYCSVETLQSRRCFKSDMWSVGVILYHEMYKKFPFKGNTINDIFREVFCKEINFEENCPEEGRDFLSRCLTRNLEDRMTAVEALHHSWLCEEPDTL
jgi:serine/threonine protein kinase